MRSRAALLVPLAVYLLAVSSFLGDSYSRFDFPLDDAWIHRVYSRSVAFGRGFEYNQGAQEAGSTSPLWAIVTAPAHWFEAAGEGAVVAVVKLIGVLLGLTVVFAVNRLVRAVTGSALAGTVAASLFALEPRFLFSCLSGMENVLLLALWVGGSAALFVNRPLASVILFALAPVTRPEAVILLPLCLPGLIRFSRGRVRRAARLGAWLIPVVPVVVWALFCKSSTGHFLANTFYMKTRPFQFGLGELDIVRKSLLLGGLAPVWAFVPGAAAGAVAFWMGPRKMISLAALVVAPCVYLVGVLGTREVFLEGYYWTRWLDPACIVLMIPCCAGFGFVFSWGLGGVSAPGPESRWPGHLRRTRMAAAIAGAALLAAAVPSHLAALADRRGHLSTDSRAIRIMNVEPGKWIREHTPEGSVVAANDAGAIRYFGRRRTIDILGLNSADIAFHKMDARQAIMDADWLAIFPSWFSGTSLGVDIAASFEPRVEVRIPLEEYTVCRNAGQTVMVILERKRRVPQPTGG